MHDLRIQTKFCIVSPKRLLHPAQLVVRYGRIVEIVEGRPHKPDVDLGETVLMPGLVNAHTHLEFSQLQEPFPAGENFPAWISQVVRYRTRQSSRTHDAERRATFEGTAAELRDQKLGRTHDAERRATFEEPRDQLSSLQRALLIGLQEAFHTGTTLLGDIVTAPWMPSDYPSANRFVVEEARRFGECASGSLPHRLSSDGWREHLQPVMVPRVLPFTELIGMTEERCSESCQWSRAARATQYSELQYSELQNSRLQNPALQNSELQIDSGVSPHAPYSLHFPTLSAAVGQLPTSTRVAMHVAESREELQWCEHQTGPFRDAFERLGLSTSARPASIMLCIELLARFKYALLIHGNYLDRDQIERIAASGSIAVVYCPRTHLHFGHAPYPWQALRAAGVPVLLGTDSRASNPSLSLWDEVSTAAKLHPQCSPSQWLESVTLGPARALGVTDDFGSLQIGRWASAVAMPARTEWSVENLLEALCASSAQELEMRPMSTMLGFGSAAG